MNNHLKSGLILLVLTMLQAGCSKKNQVDPKPGETLIEEVEPKPGEILVYWIANGAIIDDHTRTGDPFPDGLPLGALFQLIWSPDSTAGTIDPTNPTVPTGGDIVLDTYASTGPVSTHGITKDSPNQTRIYGNADDPGGPLPNGGVGGFIYTRVFNASTPSNGNFYAETTPSGPVPDAHPRDDKAPFDADITRSEDPAIKVMHNTNTLCIDRPILVPKR